MATTLAVPSPGTVRPISSRRTWTQDMDDQLRQAYKRVSSREELSIELDRFERQWRFPRHAITRRSHQLGIRLHSWTRWSPDDILQLRNYAGEIPIARISENLHRHPSTVKAKLREMGLSSALTDGYSRQELAELFGVSGEKVSRWMGRGWLSTIHGRVPHSAVLAFLSVHLDEISFRRCNEFWVKNALIEISAMKKPVKAALAA